MIKSGKIAGSRVLSIIEKNMMSETAEDILQYNFNLVIPIIMNRYIPIESYGSVSQGLFKLALDILAWEQFAVPST